ncbi:hypothetical protein V8C86DRAFT_2851738 [Haematococcus lacustris]
MSELRARRGHSDGVWKANRPAGTTNRFQSEWLEGREMWLVDFGLQDNLYRVRCIACDLVLNSHLHTIQKHEDSAKHKQNLAAKQKSSEAVQAFKAALTTAAAKRKEQMKDPATVTQFAAVFYLLKLGRPMTDIEHTPDLLRVARTAAIAAKHWKDDSAWQIAEALYSVMRKHDLEVLQSATFLSLSLDEATTVDNLAKQKLTAAAQAVVQDLRHRFVAGRHAKALAIVYPNYWDTKPSDEDFLERLEAINTRRLGCGWMLPTRRGAMVCKLAVKSGLVMDW